MGNADKKIVSSWQAAIDYGIDVSQLDYLLSLTPAQRIERHEQALALVRALQGARVHRDCPSGGSTDRDRSTTTS